MTRVVFIASVVWVVSLSILDSTALADTRTASTATTSSVGGSLLDELDRALGTPITKPNARASASESSGASPLSTIQRGFQTLNPDLSAILDVTGGFSERAPLRLAGDDPDLKGGLSEHGAGVTLQEAELAVQSIVDPYFRADLFLTIPNQSGLEVEEGFLTTTALPFDLQLRAGIFRSALGRQNGQHLHLQDFTRRPLINAAYLGTDGLRPPGAQLSWLLPLPFFVQLNLEAFSVDRPDDLTQFSTFGGGKRTDLTYASELKVFWPLSESISVYAGANAAFGRTAGLAPPAGGMGSAPVSDAGPYANDRTQLFGGDLYVKFKPPNVAETYFSLAWTTEYFLRRVLDADVISDGGFYTQLVIQIARRWFLGVREDVLGVPSSSIQPRVTRTSGSITFAGSEFSRVRGYIEREFAQGDGLSPANSTAAYVQLEVAIGAHGAHPF